MKRDMELIRTILLNVENDKYQYGQRVHVDGVSDQTCAYHVALMVEEGLVVGNVLKTGSSPYAAAQIDRLTSEGHDFCEGIRQATIWNKVKKDVLKPGAAWTVKFVIQCVKKELYLHLGVPPTD